MSILSRHSDPSSDPAARELLEIADRCVKCGLCLPHCPTYLQTADESESPRGRIALIQGWLGGQLAMTDTLAGHLDGCLSCRACERVCPSLVPYGQLLDLAKARRVSAATSWRSRIEHLWLRAVTEGRGERVLISLARLYEHSGLAGLMRSLRLARIPWFAPWHRLAWSFSRAGEREVRPVTTSGEIALFVGCLEESAQANVVQAALRVFRRLGQTVFLPPEHTCCGALLQHNGYPQEAHAQREASVALLGGRPVVGLSSACVAELLAHTEPGEVEELCAFLDQLDWPHEVTLHPLPVRVLVHEPCSHRNLLGGNAAVYRLLERIPGVELVPWSGDAGCCGAAGTYMIQQPEMSGALLRSALEVVREARPALLVTTNIGCALHLAAGLHESGQELEVLHPVELLARQLAD